ncbi:MAG: (d)CMP kinase [Elusimicrobiales bacterium]|nr:(d)CMP kinase [Elusimicrobiales bacterium]
MRKNGIVIAMDGPAGAGKSSVGREVAKKIGYKFISTGKMYRAVAWLCMQKQIDLNNEDAVVEIAITNPISFKETSSEEPFLTINNIKLDSELYCEEVAAKTSLVAKMPKLRKFLVEEQRKIGKDGGVIMEGRDITTNVFPDAELKIYLDASPQARAKRRVNQLAEQNIFADYNEILEMIKSRDLQDSTRINNPLLKSSDSIYIDTTNISQSEVIEKILSLYYDTLKRLTEKK